MSFRGTLTTLAPVAWWRLEETSGTTAADSAGSNPGTYTGTPTLGATGLAPLDTPNLAVDLANSALRYVQVAHAAALNPATLSIVALIDPTSINGNNRIYEKGLADSGVALKIEGTDLRFQVPGRVTINYPHSRIGTARRLIVATYDSTSGVAWLYVDGRAVATGTAGTPGAAPAPSDPLRIGQKPGGTTNSDGWNGKLQHIALFNRVLTVEEVTTLGDQADLDAEHLWWQGELWTVANRGVAAPFANSFAGSQAVLDSSGDLHLRIANTGGASLGAEIASVTQGRGYGTYRMRMSGRTYGMHPNVVFGGMFTYGADANYGNRELDACEQSAWSGATGPWTLGHVVWAPAHASNPAPPRGGFDAADVATLADWTQNTVMVWAPEKITFRTYRGDSPTSVMLWRESVVTAGQAVTFDIEGGGSYTGPILLPVPSDERVHFNLWVCPNYSGTSDPATVTATELIVTDFSYSASTIVPEHDGVKVDIDWQKQGWG